MKKTWSFPKPNARVDVSRQSDGLKEMGFSEVPHHQHRSNSSLQRGPQTHGTNTHAREKVMKKTWDVPKSYAEVDESCSSQRSDGLKEIFPSRNEKKVQKKM